MKEEYKNNLVTESYPYDGTKSCECYTSMWDYWWSEARNECDVDCDRDSGRNCMRKLVD